MRSHGRSRTKWAHGQFLRLRGSPTVCARVHDGSPNLATVRYRSLFRSRSGALEEFF
jgi:hypothetical protein